MEIKTVGVACDHAGYPLKKYVLMWLEEHGYEYKDYGTWSDQSVDYPDFAHELSPMSSQQVLRTVRYIPVSPSVVLVRA